ncbi:TonB-dependent receptor [Adhaeribacter terreus]|uniref:Carboxypeptidase regulatory-like domain-containing protein n=1 Tax=Adhaeribacter terreus TaxID=529703 RepID=A0ABW0E9V2_9BACT
MMRKLLLLFAFLGFTYGAALAQTGKLAGKLIDKTTREPIPFGNVVVKLNGAQKGYGQTDINGFYSISPLTPGAYTVEVPNVGYITRVISGVEVTVDKTTSLNIELSQNVQQLNEVEITAYEVPIIGPEKVGQTLTKEQIMKVSTREVTTLVQTASNVGSTDDGKAVSIKGQRPSGTAYYVNGVKQLVAPNLPTSAIAQMTVISGGVPAQYGDQTGGVVNITTTAPSSKFMGGIEAETSAPFDKYHNNLVNFNLTGPLIQKKSVDTTDFTSNRTILGFFLAGQYQGSRDDNPSAQGVYTLKDDVKARLEDKPLVADPQGGYTYTAQTLTLNDFEKGKLRPNVKNNIISVNTSLEFQPKDNMMFSFGGNINHSQRDLYQLGYSVFNSDNNPEQRLDNWMAYARFTQNFKDAVGDSSANPLKNAYYQIQVDYSKYDRTIQNKRLKDNIWRYGYLGKFDQTVEAFYSPGTVRVKSNPNDPNDTTTTVYRDAMIDRGDISTGVTFSRDENSNPITANYTKQIIDDRFEAGNEISNLIELQILGGLLNGQNPFPVYSMYSNVGTMYSTYQLLNNDQFRLSALGSAEWGKHTFKLGFEFEQRVETNYGVNASGLWNWSRGLLSTDMNGLDKDNYIVSTRDVDGIEQTFIDFAYKPNATQSTFSQNLRKKLGLAANQPINIDAVSPEDLSTSMFSADELITPGLVSYQGYTYDGKRSTKKVAFNDYFSDVANRPQDAVRPIYTAAFIEDKFQIEDLTLRAGVRVDRFDANQKVLKDPYTLVETLKAGNVRDLRFADNYAIPSNIGDDYVVYVNKNSADFQQNQTSASNFGVVGYRKGDVFYDVNGTPTDNLAEIQKNGTFPLFDPALQGTVGSEYLPDRRLSVRAFKDYEPQFVIMPRISFSFPISEDALFFAHYDITSQRPERNGTLPSDYYFLLGSINARNEINNPDLKPQKKIDYEVGFEQRLTRSSGLTISAFYSENRDQISFRKYTGAFPQDYITFSNLDFGVVKGMTLEYDLRRTKNVSMNASYTLQFAKGTGSSATSGYNLVSQGQPNLRTPIPLDFDQRHNFKVNFDFRFRDNEGPVLFDNKIFQNAGINFNLNAASGTPYSRQANITNFINAIGRPVLEGSLNGSNLPANFRVGLRLDKDFNIKGSEDGKSFVKSLNVYFRVQNLFNTMNVLNVYRYTGSASDDGYLDTYREKFGSEANQSLMDLYTIRLLNGDNNTSNPSNYSLPRRAQIGCVISF